MVIQFKQHGNTILLPKELAKVRRARKLGASVGTE